MNLNKFLAYLNLWANFKPFILNSVEEIVLKLNEHNKTTPWSIGEDFIADANCKVKNLFCGKFLTYNSVNVVYIGLNPNMVHFYDTYEDNKVIYTNEMQKCFLAVDIVFCYARKNKKYAPISHPKEKEYEEDNLEKYNYYRIDLDSSLINGSFVESVIKIINDNFKKK